MPKNLTSSCYEFFLIKNKRQAIAITNLQLTAQQICMIFTYPNQLKLEDNIIRLISNGRIRLHV